MQILMRNATFVILFFLETIDFQLCYGSFYGGCIQGEREALLKFKKDLTDPSNRLASWDEDGDCCKWSGVICHNLTGHVLELNLRTLSIDEYYPSESKNAARAIDAAGGLTTEYFDHLFKYSDYFKKTAFGGKVNESLLDLKHLEYLDLSNSNFGGTPFPEFVGSMESLRILNLSNAGFGGMVPYQFGNLSNLQYLNLYSNYDDKVYVENLQWLKGLPSLEFLDFGGVDLSKASDWLDVINSLPFLVELHFQFCRLPNVSPLPTLNLSSLSVLDLSQNRFQKLQFEFIQNLTWLKVLDLSYNDINSAMFNWVYSFSNLEHLSVKHSQLQGGISSDIGNLTSLVSLDLSDNDIDGEIPKSFKNLCKLRSISLWKARLGQEINDIFELLFPCISNVLEELYLTNCHLSGFIPDYLGQFKGLTTLVLSQNSIVGPIPVSIGNLKELQFLDLSQNNLNGTLPTSFCGLVRLEIAHISHNAMNGEVFETHFENLTKLETFNASGNKFRLRVSPHWKAPRFVRRVGLGGWSIGPEFPSWVRSLKQFDYLDLSNSGIASQIPSWFWNLPLRFDYLNISNNQIHGLIPYKPSSPWRQLFGVGPVVDLSSNHFQGPLPYIFSNSNGLFLSNNSFSGPMSSFLCHNMYEQSQLQVLDVAGNKLSGEIPDCWMKWQRLNVVILNNNKLSGKLPWSIGALTMLRSLHLRNNSLTGQVPLSLRNCTKLTALDLAENKLVGKIPTWVGETFLDMVFLSFRTNNFNGLIPESFCWMTRLHILDLADNNLTGVVPKCLHNFSAMVSKDGSTSMLPYEYDNPYYYSLIIGASIWSSFDSMLVVTKGKMNTYASILKFVRAIDFSKNTLSGQIPEELTSLQELVYLNLSENQLTGRIPANIGDMKSMEAMDFSQNELLGEVPQSMAKMTFLSVLNLSFNHFSGRIPLSTQIQSFPPSSFMGNEELCGSPLVKHCDRDDETPSTNTEREEEDDDHEINWFYVSMPVGFVVGFWATFGPLVFNRRWRGLYFHFLENLWDKIWLWWHFM